MESVHPALILSAFTATMLGYFAWRGTGSLSRGFSVGCAGWLVLMIVPPLVGSALTRQQHLSPDVVPDVTPEIVIGNLLVWIALAALYYRRAS